MKTIIIIQARMGSTRLPGKVLMELGSISVLDYVVSRAQKVNQVDEVIVATTTLAQDNPIAQWCEDTGVAYYRGSEDDVLARYYHCAVTYAPDYIMRITADCPFMDYQLASAMVAVMEKHPSDIVILQGEPPRGLTAELISFSALSYIYEHGLEPRHREHVTYYAYEHIDTFTKTNLPIPDYLQHTELRITLDTLEDLAVCKAIANHYPGDKEMPSSQVVAYLLAHPEIASMNAHIDQKSVV